jgi:hypothetical protein
MQKQVTIALLSIFLCITSTLFGMNGALYSGYPVLSRLAATRLAMRARIQEMTMSSAQRTVEWIRQTAWQHMSPELRSCTTFADINNLLNKEEHVLLKAVKHSFALSDIVWNKRLDQIARRKQYLHDVYYKQPSGTINHELATIDPVLFKEIIQACEEQGINPECVDILYNKEWHAEYSKAHALAQSPILLSNPILVIQRARISMLPLNSPTIFNKNRHRIHVTRHEIEHLAVGHGAQTSEIRTMLITEGYNQNSIESNQAWKDWRRIQEKQAELIPLLKFKNEEHVDVAWNYSIDYCHEKLQKGKKINWNRSSPNATHPSPCAELLPYMEKILELMQQEKQSTGNS